MRDARHRVGACEYRGRGRTWGLRQRLLDAPCLAWKVSATADSLPKARTQERPQKVHLPKAAKKTHLRVGPLPVARFTYPLQMREFAAGEGQPRRDGARALAPVRHGTTQVALS
jgi:hypothetical protein